MAVFVLPWVMVIVALPLPAFFRAETISVPKVVPGTVLPAAGTAPEPEPEPEEPASVVAGADEEAEAEEVADGTDALAEAPAGAEVVVLPPPQQAPRARAPAVARASRAVRCRVCVVMVVPWGECGVGGRAAGRTVRAATGFLRTVRGPAASRGTSPLVGGRKRSRSSDGQTRSAVRTTRSAAPLPRPTGRATVGTRATAHRPHLAAARTTRRGRSPGRPGPPHRLGPDLRRSPAHRRRHQHPGRRTPTQAPSGASSYGAWTRTPADADAPDPLGDPARRTPSCEVAVRR